MCSNQTVAAQTPPFVLGNTNDNTSVRSLKGKLRTYAARVQTFFRHRKATQQQQQQQCSSMTSYEGPTNLLVIW